MRSEDAANPVQGLHRRDPKAFAGLWDAQQRTLWSIASAVMGDDAGAEAALREAVELAWAECDRARGNPATWLISVCGRVLLARGDRSPTQEFGRDEGAREPVLEVLSGLSISDRTLLLLHHLGGLDADALSGLAQRDSRTVRRAIHRGRCAIAKLMDETDGRPETTDRRAGKRRKAGGGNHVSNHSGGGRHSGTRFSTGSGEDPLRHR